MIEYPNKVLLATDGTDDSNTAAMVAVALAGKTGAELHIVHVGQPPSYNTGTTIEAASLPSESYEHVVKRAQKLLERQLEQIQEAGGNVAGAHLRIGQPPYQVVAVSEELGADLLIVGSGRPRAIRRAAGATMRRAVIGRAADHIVRSALCPVLVVRGDVASGAADPSQAETAASDTGPA